MQHIRTSHLCAKCHRKLNEAVSYFDPCLPAALVPSFLETELIGLNSELVPIIITDKDISLSTNLTSLIDFPKWKRK